VDLRCSAHALEIDLNGRLHDPPPSVLRSYRALTIRRSVIARMGFAAFWRWKSRRLGGRPQIE
jgi:hypothetical protein